MLQVSISDRKSTVRPFLRAGSLKGGMCAAFGTFIGDLCVLADWLKQCGIETVAMESTGVYWIALYELLVERGFEGLLVDARQAKNVPGRKSDVPRLPVAAGVAHLRIVTRCVSPGRSGLHPTQLPASTLDVSELCLPSHPAHAKGARADEPKAFTCG